MRELSFMGPSNDGKRLLLVADDGTQFELVVDSRLVSVVSREHGTSARPAKSTGKASTMPSPREIQDQIRHGATVEEIANATGVSPDDVAKFAYPVITERAYIADQARAALVKVGAELITLEAAVLQRVQPRAVDPRLLRWDAWRAEGTTWTVIAAYPANQGERIATFSFNSADKSVSANDDEGRWMLEVGEAVTRPSGQAAPSAPRAVQQDDAPVQRPRPHVVPSAPSNTTSLSNSQRESEPQQTVRASTEDVTSNRSWDRAHPAARAHERREANGESHSTNGAATSSEESSASRVNPEHPAAIPSTNQVHQQAPAVPPVVPPTAPVAKEEPPQWEELLFGSPQHDDSN